tara:strand:- start:51 stop:221 length:171 start_codon:yes stop_codon:yes gene_type:complete
MQVTAHAQYVHPHDPMGDFPLSGFYANFPEERVDCDVGDVGDFGFPAQGDASHNCH